MLIKDIKAKLYYVFFVCMPGFKDIKAKLYYVFFCMCARVAFIQKYSQCPAFCAHEEPIILVNIGCYSPFDELRTYDSQQNSNISS